MTFDVIIATYNRHFELARLVNQIVRFNRKPQQLIIVDSSDVVDTSFGDISSIVKYKTVSHRNQPYQRFAGVYESDADVVIFFDDDVEIINEALFHDVLDVYERYQEIVGVGVGIDYQNNISLLGQERGVHNQSRWFKAFTRFTGAYIPSEGKIAKAGITGGGRRTNGYVEFFNGPMMSFRSKVAHKIFDARLFNSYAHGVGKGEDKYLSMGALQYGKLFVLNENYVRHPLNESHYFKDPRAFQKRVVFSRWLLSKRLAEVRNDAILFYLVHFIWFTSWRLIVATLLRILKPSDWSRKSLRGQIDGVIALLLKYNKLAGSYDWKYWSKVG